MKTSRFEQGVIHYNCLIENFSYFYPFDCFAIIIQVNYFTFLKRKYTELYIIYNTLERLLETLW